MGVRKKSWEFINFNSKSQEKYDDEIKLYNWINLPKKSCFSKLKKKKIHSQILASVTSSAQLINQRLNS